MNSLNNKHFNDTNQQTNQQTEETKEDNQEKIIIKIIITESFCRNPTYSSCYHKCPCPKWINCRYYIDETEKQRRLKYRHKHDQKLKTILLWYDNSFKIDWMAGNYCANG